jgi:hypothetical protein
MAGGVAQEVPQVWGPEFKPHCCKKKRKEKKVNKINQNVFPQHFLIKFF